MDTAILVVGHGSRRGTYVDELKQLARWVSSRIGARVEAAFNEYSEPNWRSSLRMLLEEGYKRVVIALAFLGSGNHVHRDIMGELGISEFGKWVWARLDGIAFQAYVTHPLATSPLIGTALLHRVLDALDTSHIEAEWDPEEIEEESMKHVKSIIEARFGDLDEEVAWVVARAIHASGNPDLVHSIHVDRDAIRIGIEALRAGATIVADVKMVAAGIRWRKVVTYVDSEEAKRIAEMEGITRAAAGIRLALKLDETLIAVIGNSPTALIELVRSRRDNVALVIATPPGFVNAEKAKDALLRSGIPSIVVKGTHGGSGVAAAITNALIDLALRGS